MAYIDVPEHIEPQLIDQVLDDLQRVTEDGGIFTAHTSAAIKILPDGRNARLIQKPAAWGLPKLPEQFELGKFDRVPNGFIVIVERRLKPAERLKT